MLFRSGSLDAKLLEEGGSHDGGCGSEGVRVQECAADDADEDDRESPAEDLRSVPDNDAAGYGAEIGHDLGHGDGVGGEVVLVRQQSWV